MLSKEKIEAWQRLEDKGFRFMGWRIPKDGPARIEILGNCVSGSADDLNLLFGGNDGVE